MGFAIFVLLMIGLILWLSRRILFRKKVIRKLSMDRIKHEAARVPVRDKCPCGMPRCRYKGKQHPPAILEEAPLRNRHKHGG